MPRNRMLSATAAAILLVASHVMAADTAGALAGKWAFTGKDSAGVAWKGHLNIETLGENSVYCDLQVQSTKMGKGVGSTCKYDPATRTLSFGSGSGSDTTSAYSAVLSADGKSLTKGKWSESKKEKGQSAATVLSAGEWAATLTGK